MAKQLSVALPFFVVMTSEAITSSQSVGWNNSPKALLNAVSVQQARVGQYYQ